MIAVKATNFNAVNASHLRALGTGGIFTVGNRSYQVTCAHNDIRVVQINENHKNGCGAFFAAVFERFGCSRTTNAAADIAERLIEIKLAENERESKHAQPIVAFIDPYEGNFLTASTTGMHVKSTIKIKKILALLEEDICTLSASSHRPACDPNAWNMPKDYERSMLRIKIKLQSEISQLTSDLENPINLEQVEYNLQQFIIQWDNIKSLHYKSQEYLAGLVHLKSERALNLNSTQIIDCRVKAMLNAVYDFSQQPLSPSGIHEQLENFASIARALSDDGEKLLQQCAHHLDTISGQERSDFIALLKNRQTTLAQLFLCIGIA